MSQNILIIGATSAIAEATARLFASKGETLYLLGHNMTRLKTIAARLMASGANQVFFNEFDAHNFAQHPIMLEKVIDEMTRIDITLIAHGTLPNQQACQSSFQLALKEINTNAISCISILTWLANYYSEQCKGTIAVITSIAGDKGRQSNYIYGSAKGMLSIYLQGLRNRLHQFGIQVLTIKPGFVDTPMTKNMQPNLLWVKPDYVARKILAAIHKNRNEIYVPGIWRFIILIIRSIPEVIFKRLHF